MTREPNIERHLVRCTDDDQLAAIQILACIARSHRQKRIAAAGDLMQQWYWARKRHRREGMPADLAISVPDKDRINSKLPALAKDVGLGLQAGEWLEQKWMAKSEGIVVRAFGASIRQQAADQWNDDHRAAIGRGGGEATSVSDETATPKQRVWTKRRPVAHMALAVLKEARESFDNGPKELEALVFNTGWVAPALERAERYAKAAIQCEILEPHVPWHFVR